MSEIIVCKECNLEKPEKARGLCASCYGKIGRKLAICEDCGETKSYYAKGLCRACYNAQHRQENKSKIIICKECGQARPYYAKSLCSTCYRKARCALGVCRICGLEKPIHARGRCEACYKREYRQLYPERVKAIEKRAYIRHCKKKNASSKANYYKNREHYRELSRLYNLTHQEEIRVMKAKYREEHLDEFREYMRGYYPKWAQKNPEKIQIKRLRRRAHEAQVPDTLTTDQIAQLHAIGHCFYCGETTNLSTDHFVPIAARGGNTKANVVLACRKCNSKKSAKLPERYLIQLKLKNFQEQEVVYG